MPTLPTFDAALDVLKSHIETEFASNVALRIDSAQEPPYLDVVRLEAQPSEPERVGAAHILLSGTDAPEPAWGTGARRATVVASCRAGEAAGALEGAENLEAIQKKTARLLQIFIENNYQSLRDAGLLNNQSARTQNGTIASTKETAALHFVDVQITFVFLTQ